MATERYSTRQFDYLRGSQPAGHYHAEFDALRAECPTFRSTGRQDYWVVSKMEDLRRVYSDPATFSNRGLTLVAPDPDEPGIPMQLDPPEHTVWRKPLMSEFSPARVKALEPVMRERCVALLNEFVASGSCDYVADFARRYPVAVFLAMLDLPQTELDRFVEWESAVLHPDLTDPIQLVRMQRAVGEVKGFFAELLERRRDNPGVDLASRAWNWQVDGRSPTAEELQNVFFILFIAGLDTIASELSYSLWHLATHDADRSRIVNEPAVIPSAVEELLRHYNIILDGRKIMQDTDVTGCPMRTGDYVLLLAGAANRDPDSFDRADEVVLDRNPNRHVTFGWGIHRCVGAHLARQEMKVALEEWHRLIPEYRLTPGVDVRERAFIQLFIESLPLEWPTP